MLGSILSNILLVLGMSFTACVLPQGPSTFTDPNSAGFYFAESTFQATAAQASSSLLTLAGITLVIPAAYHSSSKAGNTAHTLWPSLLNEDRDGGAPNPDSEDLKGLLILSRGTAVILLLTYVRRQCSRYPSADNVPRSHTLFSNSRPTLTCSRQRLMKTRSRKSPTWTCTLPRDGRFLYCYIR